MSTIISKLVNVGRRAVTLVAASFFYASVSYAQIINGSASMHSQKLLPAVAKGNEALVLLGGRVSEVAKRNDLSEEMLRHVLTHDSLVRVDPDGRLFFEERTAVPTGSTLSTTSISTAAAAPLDQTFQLHSRPGASRVIYLDFNGAVLSGTVWDSGKGTITAEPYDLDGFRGSFSNTELIQIQNIWQRVAEDFAPFDVDVTTEQPSEGAITRFSDDDETFGTTVLVTRRTFYNCNCGGVAYLRVYPDIGNYYKPALVFFDMLSYNEKFIAEAIAHEAGHNLGLLHDGIAGGCSGCEYYAGHGSGATGWAPIMGVGYYQELVQWSRGEYANANNQQDDLYIMQQYGLLLLQDDHGNSFATASVLPPSNGGRLFAGQGIIEHPDDVDIFRLSAGAGILNVAVNPAVRSPNLDIHTTLRASNGSVLSLSNPSNELNSRFSLNLNEPTTLFVAVRGVGNGNPLTDGYSNYGSLGRYSINITNIPISEVLVPIINLLLSE